MEKKEHLFEASFEAPISHIKHIDELGDSSMMISRASVAEFGDYFPAHVDIDRNFDLLGVYFDAANVNKFNNNGQGIAADLAVEMLSLFNHKPTNIEHDPERIVGHIVNSMFTEHGSSRDIIKNKDAKKRTDVFDISLASVIYSLADKDFSDLVEMSADEDNVLYQKISASWEIGFSEYDLAVGSDLLSECEIISDQDEVADLKDNLKIYGGTGTLPDGRPVYQLIRKAIPIGIGFTNIPAGHVKGVVTENSEKKDEEIDENLSQNQSIAVKTAKATKITKMDEDKNKAAQEAVTKLEKILAKHELSETSVASITESFSKKLEEANEKFVTERTELKTAAEEATAKVTDLETSVAAQAEELKALKEKTDAYELEKAQAAAITLRDSRLEEIEEEFVVEKDARVAILNQIDGLSEEAYASYRSQLDVLLAGSKKSVVEQARLDAAELEKANASKISDTSDEDIKKTIDTAKASTTEVPNGSKVPSSEDKSYASKFAEAFEGENSVKVRV